MNKEMQFTLPHRRQLVESINIYSELRRRVKEKWQQKREELSGRFVEETAKKVGADKLVPSITAAEKTVKDLRAKLVALGFGLGSDGLFIHDDADQLDSQLDKLVTKEIGSQAVIDGRFEEAQVEIMTAADLEEARAVLKKLLN
jgi:DNA-binding transcriptional regulator PaaX